MCKNVEIVSIPGKIGIDHVQLWIWRMIEWPPNGKVYMPIQSQLICKTTGKQQLKAASTVNGKSFVVVVVFCWCSISVTIAIIHQMNLQQTNTAAPTTANELHQTENMKNNEERENGSSLPF